MSSKRAAVQRTTLIDQAAPGSGVLRDTLLILGFASPATLFAQVAVWLPFTPSPSRNRRLPPCSRAASAAPRASRSTWSQAWVGTRYRRRAWSAGHGPRRAPCRARTAWRSRPRGRRARPTGTAAETGGASSARRRSGRARRRWTATAEPRSTRLSGAGVSGGLGWVSLYMILRARNVFTHYPPHLIAPSQQVRAPVRAFGYDFGFGQWLPLPVLLFARCASYRLTPRPPSRCALSGCSISRSYLGSRMMLCRPASARFRAARAYR